MEIKSMNIEELDSLAQNIRQRLIEVVSKNGGHLGPNLGVVELTIAIHKVFDSPKDKILFDVGHQSYVHKILTEREDRFHTIRQKNGLGPFTSREESEHDHFVSGHAGNALSAGLGFAVGDKNNHVITLIGDASLGNGVSLEALNNIGSSKVNNLIIVFNDNEMSIGENVGVFSKAFRKVMNTNAYNELKHEVETTIRKSNFGNSLADLISRVEKSVKGFVTQGGYMESLGYEYLGPIDGHNIEALISVFEVAKKMDKPVFLHVKTKKGKGYKFAEDDMEKFHGIAPFDVETGETAKGCETYSQVFGKKIVEMAEKDNKINAISAAMIKGTGLSDFFRKFPDRAHDVGIAEEHGVIFGGALALTDKKVFIALYSTFLQRTYDQLIHDIAIQKIPVKFVIDRAGIVGEDGKTHQGIFDIAFLLTIPKMAIIAPTTCKELTEALELSKDYSEGPIAIRLPRANCFNIENNKKLEFGKWNIVKEGKKDLIIATGSMLEEILKIENSLEKEGLCPTIVAAAFINPLDNEFIIKEFPKYDRIFVLEEGIKKSGFGSYILEFLNDNGIVKNVNRIALNHEFIEHGSRDELLEECGLRGKKLIKSILEGS